MLSRLLIFIGEKDLSSNVFSAIDSENKNLRGLNCEIHEHPELGWHEKYAHRVLTDYLEKQGFNVTRGAYNLSTAFIAEYSNGKGRPVSFNAEYDALPGMGHACGHNLIATASVAAGLGIKNALKSGGLKGKVTIVGTPAEEIGGGKAKLIQAGAYDDLDCSLMAHPGPRNYLFYAEYPALMTARVNWTGVPAQWNGLNALDGFVSAYIMAGLLRQQLEFDTAIQQVLSESSNVLNIIPVEAKSEWAIMCPTMEQRAKLEKKMHGIWNASATATGTNVTLKPYIFTSTRIVDRVRANTDLHSFSELDYWNVKLNSVLTRACFKNQMEFFDPENTKDGKRFSYKNVEEEILNPKRVSPTDQGNISHKLP
ncbi:hypothetical protein FOPG_16052 [Fusarium oxysporum f. sp. conglutinans race 2 54008]|uniref:Uncharacterized protein n=1 Tax=Fusarium oxysporum f. sp. conglutinans race 2 54008 TaxID=1089457 RepID=X0GW57_FUSOX|nr:hypothetical protein FOPG_16052 [Fusarium oxysporum f. sp. conglutinans race 2 54008]